MRNRKLWRYIAGIGIYLVLLGLALVPNLFYEEDPAEGFPVWRILLLVTLSLLLLIDLTGLVKTLRSSKREAYGW